MIKLNRHTSNLAIKNFYQIPALVGICLLFLISPCQEASSTENDVLDLISKFHKLHAMKFEEIPKTAYRREQDEIIIQVKNSASFLYFPLEKVRSVYGFKVIWTYDRPLNLKSSKQELQKNGDDALLRIGLLTHGPSHSLPFFTPAWIRTMDETLRHSANGIIWYLAGSRQGRGHRWANPYSEEIHQVSLGPARPKTWTVSSETFKDPIKISAIAFGSDGDNTLSTFEIRIKHLSIWFSKK